MITGISFKFQGQVVTLDVNLYHCGVIGEEYKRIHLSDGYDDEFGTFTDFVQYPAMKSEWTVFLKSAEIHAVLAANGVVSQGFDVITDIGPNDMYWRCELTSKHIRELVTALREEKEDRYHQGLMQKSP